MFISRFLAAYKNLKRNGKGTYTFANEKGTYVGEYVDNKRHGLGVATYADRSTYNGNWRSNKRHGHGVYTYANGDKYCGGWVNGARGK